MIESAIFQAIFKLFMALAAILMARFTLVWLDKNFDTDFAGTMKDADPNARMYYFAARFVGVCLIVGLAI